MAKWNSVPYGCRENPGVFDTGNGAIATIEECSAYPGIERVTIGSYCGRSHDNGRYYRLADDGQGAFVRPGAPSFESLAAARAEYRRR